MIQISVCTSLLLLAVDPFQCSPLRNNPYATDMIPSQEQAHFQERLTIESETVKRINSDGRIPIIVTLAPTSLSAPTGPPPLHFLIMRQTYLHLGLAKAISRLHLFAPITFQGTKWQEPDPGESEGEDDAKEQAKTTEQPTSDLPICWWEDEATQMPLRWQLFTGVLYDLHASNSLPWRLRLHFTNYPSQLLPFSVQSLRSHFQNSIKQAIVLRAGSGRAALQWLTKEAHEDLWQSLHEINHKVLHEWRSRLSDEVQNQRVPIRMLVSEGSPYLQKSCMVDRHLTLGRLLREWLPNAAFSTYTDKDGESQIVASVSWKIQGIQPPFDALVMDLWESLCHPDSYLYIVVSTK